MPSLWGEDALTELLDLAITVAVSGAAPASPLSATVRPAGVDWTVSCHRVGFQ